jgi:hypothetical protein
MWTTNKTVGALLVMMLSFGLLHKAQAEEHSMKMPEKYSEAIAALEHHTEAVDKAIKDGKLDTLHKHGEEIKMLAQMLPKLSMKEGSGVAETDVKDINLTSKKLAATYEPLDEAGDAGKKEESKKVYDEIVTLVATLKKYVK